MFDPCRWSPQNVYHEEYTPLIVVFYTTFSIEIVLLIVCYFVTRNDFVPRDGRDLNSEMSDLDLSTSRESMSRLSEQFGDRASGQKFDPPLTSDLSSKD